MTGDEFDRILAREETLEPSSGFAAAVMSAVEREAATPAAIPFPWRRALPGLAAAAVAFVSLGVAAAVFFVRSAGAGSAQVPGAISAPAISSWGAALDAAKHSGVGWVALALVLSLVCVKVSMRLAE